MAKIKIIDKREIPSADPGRVGKFDTMITYQTDPMRSYLIRIPEEELTEETLKLRIKEDVKKREQWVGKEIDI